LTGHILPVIPIQDQAPGPPIIIPGLIQTQAQGGQALSRVQPLPAEAVHPIQQVNPEQGQPGVIQFLQDHPPAHLHRDLLALHQADLHPTAADHPIQVHPEEARHLQALQVLHPHQDHPAPQAHLQVAEGRFN